MAVYTPAALQGSLESLASREGRKPFKVIERALLAYKFAQHYARSHHLDFDQLLDAQQNHSRSERDGDGESVPNSIESDGADNGESRDAV